MVEIGINGKNLSDVEMLLEPYHPNTISKMRYPKERVKISENGNDLTLQIPAFLILELFRQKIIPMDSAPFLLSTSGKNRGNYIITDLRYPTEPGSELVKIKIKKVLPLKMVEA
jgi:hypothetical protein